MGDADDVRARREFVAAFLAQLVPGSVAFHAGAFWEVQAAADGAAWHGDPRWRALYGHPLLIAAINWFGARTLLDAGAPDVDAALVGALEDDFAARLRRHLDAFWAAAAGAGPAALQTGDNLAVQWAVVHASAFVYLTESRNVSGRQLMRQAASMFRAMRVPGEIDYEYYSPKRTLDDWFFRQTFVYNFWSWLGGELWLAANTKTPPLIDPVAEFPSVPFMLPPPWLTGIPPPSERPLDEPVPENLTPWVFRVSDYLGMVDPVLSSPPNDYILAAVVGEMKLVGPVPMMLFLNYALLKVSEFSAWLKAAGLTVLQVLVAAEVRQGSSPAMANAGVLPWVAAVLANPLVDEAIRRRAFLRDAIERLETYIPADVIQAQRRSDYAAYDAALEMLPLAAREQILAGLMELRLTLMVLNSPEPFEDLVVASGAPPSPASEDSSEVADVGDGESEDSEEDPESSALDLWLSSAAFPAACSNAMIIAANSRMLLARGPASFAKSMFATFAYQSAAHAAWFNLLVLRRFAHAAAGASEGAQARALALLEAIHADISACLELLAASGQEQQLAVRTMLQGVLEGRTAVTRAEMQVMRMARQLARWCPHGGQGGGEGGSCWICATRGGGEEGDVGSGDPFAGLPEYVPLSGVTRDLSQTTTLVGSDAGSGSAELQSPPTKDGGRRVRFANEVLVYETWSKEEYPQRSMRWKDEGEKRAAAAKAEAAKTINFMLQQRDIDVSLMPDLKMFWK
ncbi:hypothetical protein DFJ74DRAFT_646873 [Hyaloraphidium curvatum]|nr:hypothetical protein DFJ74DRAFT_646873 [Hyaloraphidium curvatum]